MYIHSTLIIIMFLLNQNILRPSLLTTRFLSLIRISPLSKSFLALKILILQLSRYYILVRFSVYISSSISIAQIIIRFLQPSSFTSLLAILIKGRFASIYKPELRSLINLIIQLQIVTEPNQESGRQGRVVQLR